MRVRRAVLFRGRFRRARPAPVLSCGSLTKTVLSCVMAKSVGSKRGSDSQMFSGYYYGDPEATREAVHNGRLVPNW